MPTPLPSMLVDTGAFIARYAPNDPSARRIKDFLAREEADPSFGNWYTLPGVIGETYTFLRRHVSLPRAREFLEHLHADAHPRVVDVPWSEVTAFLLEERAAKLARGVSFVDASLVVAARKLGARHVLTVNPRDFRPFGLEPLP